MEIPGNPNGCKCSHESHILGGGHRYDEVQRRLDLDPETGRPVYSVGKVISTEVEGAILVCDACVEAGHVVEAPEEGASA